MPKEYSKTHLLLCGSSGSGKSNFNMNLALELATAASPLWMFDLYKTQLRGLGPLFLRRSRHLVILPTNDLRFNPLQAGPNEPHAHLSLLVPRLASALELPSRAAINYSRHSKIINEYDVRAIILQP